MDFIKSKVSKKLLICLVILIILIISAVTFAENLDVTKIAQDYPYKDSAIMATVLGTPENQQYKFKKPKGPMVRKLKTTKTIPDILRQWSDYEYGVWKQKSSSPLIIIISGTGSTYNSGYTMYMANIFYERGYNVIALSSPTTMPYIVSQSKDVYPGYIKDETKDLYEIMIKIVNKEKKENMKISKTYVGGFSLGGFQSILIHELDSKEKKLVIEKSLVLNSPKSILTATQRLDNFLIKNSIYDAKGLEKYLDSKFSKILYDDNLKLSEVDFGDLMGVLGKLNLNSSDFEILTGLLFRFYSANMTFAGEVFSGKNSTGRLSNKKEYKRFDSVTKEFAEGLSVSFDEYAKDLLYPYIKNTKNPDLTLGDFIKQFDLENSRDFISENNKNIVFITSKDDVLISESDLEYIKNNFTNNVIIPFGGHTGVLWHKDVAKLMVDKLEEK